MASATSATGGFGVLFCFISFGEVLNGVGADRVGRDFGGFSFVFSLFFLAVLRLLSLDFPCFHVILRGEGNNCN